MSTVLAVLGCAGTVALCGLLYWICDRYGRRFLAANETIKNQKLTIDVMDKSHRMNREKIQAIESSVAERDETIDGLIAKIEGLDKSYRVKCRELDARNCELLAMRNKATEILATSFSSNSESDADQPKKTTCDKKIVFDFWSHSPKVTAAAKKN